MRAPHRLLPYNSSKGESNVWQRVWIAKRKLKNRRRKKPSVWIGPWQEGRHRPSSIFSAATFDLARCCLVWPFVVRRFHVGDSQVTNRFCFHRLILPLPVVCRDHPKNAFCGGLLVSTRSGPDTLAASAGSTRNQRSHSEDVTIGA